MQQLPGDKTHPGSRSFPCLSLGVLLFFPTLAVPLFWGSERPFQQKENHSGHAMPKKSQREGCHRCKASPRKFMQKGWQYLDKTGKWLLFLPFLLLQEFFLQIQHFLLPALQENFWQTLLEAAKAHPTSVGKVQIKCFKSLLDWYNYPNKGSYWSQLEPSQLKKLSTHTKTAARVIREEKFPPDHLTSPEVFDMISNKNT